MVSYQRGREGGQQNVTRGEEVEKPDFEHDVIYGQPLMALKAF